MSKPQNSAECDQTGSPSSNTDKPVANNAQGYEPALKITKQRMRNGNREYLVLFTDKSSTWTTDVSQGLLNYFRLAQEKRRAKKRRKSKNS